MQGRFVFVSCAALGFAFAGNAIAQTPPARDLAPVTVSARANADPVEKSYRKMVRGMDLFEKQHALSPEGMLRFKLLPRRADTRMDNVTLEVVANKIDFPVTVAPDHTFALPRDALAYDDDAQLIPDRRKQSMTWRTEIRTPGLPPGTRRLGDLRLECQVGMEAGLVSNSRTFIGQFAKAILDTPAYCERQVPKYLFFADEPIFSVTLVSGDRREIQPIERLYGGASDDPSVTSDLPYCDCEVLLDRAYVLPLGDTSWPNDTQVEFTTMAGER